MYLKDSGTFKAVDKLKSDTNSYKDKFTTVSTNASTNGCFQSFWELNFGVKTTLNAERKEVNYTGIPRNCNRYVMLDLLPGRTGNIMFQFAALIGLAKRYDLIPLVKDHLTIGQWFELPIFPRVEMIDSMELKSPVCCVYDDVFEHINGFNNWTISGYFQSWKYFSHVKQIIEQMFTLKEVFTKNAIAFLNETRSPGQWTVCIHVRRGDMLMPSASMRGYRVAGIDFINRAMEYYRTGLLNVLFVMVSDGILWCRENIRGENITFSPFYSNLDDFALMTSCDHVVVTSGTFGWWGAWLSRGTTVYFKDYPGSGSWLASQTNREDYYPRHWVAI
ncbi:hypothetical protein DPMN_028162 [Dreissena polymorpha]|uniref:L-Fucosyltransferase n=2 Tax=Dreissena polymorpha TaxID=45954 RepID=A0A9D4RF23_DREPO|nr:hypothetical protein DPMN_028162 [Dreissena polymorpha]